MAHDPIAYAADPSIRAKRKALNARIIPIHNEIIRQAIIRLGIPRTEFRTRPSEFIKAVKAKQVEIMLEAGDLYRNAAGNLRLTLKEDGGEFDGPFLDNRVRRIHRGNTERLNKTKLVHEGATREMKERGRVYLYLIQMDPTNNPDSYKVGITWEALDKYNTARYQYRLDTRDPMAGDLYFTLAYKVERLGATMEDNVVALMREAGRPGGRPEEMYFDSLDEARAAFTSIVEVMTDAELYHDDLVWQRTGQRINLALEN